MFPPNLTATFAHRNNIFSRCILAFFPDAQALSNKGKRLFGLQTERTVKKR
jgi:hypothetical protein